MEFRLRGLLAIVVLTLVLGAPDALWGISAQSTAPVSASAAGPPSPVVQAGATGLTIDWQAPAVEMRYLRDGTVALSAEGLPHLEHPGATRLPFDSALIAVPPGAEPRLRLLSVEATTVDLLAPVTMARRPQGMVRNPQDLPATSALAPVADRARTPPGQPLILEEIGALRGVRLARLRFFPALPQKDSLRVIHRVRAEIAWGDSASARALVSTSGDLIVEQVRRAVLNPEDAVAVPRLSRASVQRSTNSSPTALLEIGRPGLYVVTYDDVDHLGFASVDPDHLRLFRGDDEVAYEWVGDDDQQLEDGERIIFYAEPRFSRWTDVDAYRLVADTVTGERVATRGASPVGLEDGIVWMEQLLEENERYMPDCFCGPLPAARDGDQWAWKELFTLGEDSAELSFDAPLVDAARAAELTLWFVGFSDLGGSPNHRVAVALNGQSLGQVEWDGRVVFSDTLSIPAALLKASDNTLELSLPGIPGVSLEGCWLDAFSVRYPRSGAASGTQLTFEGEVERRAYTVGLADTSGLRAYDVTDPLAPQRLTGVQVGAGAVELGDPVSGGPRRYALAAANALISPDAIRAVRDPWSFNAGGAPTGADLLIITHPDFAPSSDPLVALRQSQGMSVAVANVRGLYDAWSDGRIDPEALRAFIADAYAQWDPVPTYVLLVGDGSFDPRQYLPDSNRTFVPPYLADVDPWAGEAAADNRYVCVHGEDALPDMLIGRLPVKTALEATAVVDKIVAYETDPPEGLWNGNVSLIADDPDPAGDFPALVDSEQAALVPSELNLIKHYCEAGQREKDDCPGWRAAEIHDGLIQDWKDGAFLFAYTGHASWQQWGGPLPFFHLDDLLSLDHGERMPIVVGMTCFTSAFQRPEPTLDEGLVTSPNGAVATWGSTGLGLIGGHASLSRGFFSAVFVDGASRMGPAELGAKLHLASTGEDLELLDTFLVLGDPALMLNRPPTRRVFLPMVLRGG